jgi:chemotaxis-related protein WspD
MNASVPACWRRIGVDGDRSCPELERYIHCRNCHVYVDAARELLDLPAQDDYLAAWTQHYAKEVSSDDVARLSALFFRIGAEWLGLPTSALDDIADQRPVHSLPQRRGGLVLGLVNIRGELLICASLQRLLGIADVTAEKSARPPLQRLLVLRQGEHRFVLVADEVHGIEHYSPSALLRVPTTVAQASNTYSTGLLQWRDRSVGLLNAVAVFSGLERGLA